MTMKQQNWEWDQALLNFINKNITLKNMNWRNKLDEWDEDFYENKPRKSKKLPKMKDIEKSMASKKRRNSKNN